VFFKNCPNFQIGEGIILAILSFKKMTHFGTILTLCPVELFRAGGHTIVLFKKVMFAT